MAAKAELNANHNQQAQSVDVSSQPVPFTSPALSANKMSKLEKFRLEKKLNDSSRSRDVQANQSQMVELSQVEVSIPVVDQSSSSHLHFKPTNADVSPKAKELAFNQKMNKFNDKRR